MLGLGIWYSTKKTDKTMVNNMEKLEMEKIISGLLTVNGCDPEKDTYVDITRLSRRLGFKVVNAELKKDEEGFIVIAPSYVNLESDFGNKVIVVNNKMGFKWKRFIIARQFAHSVLHYKIGSVYLHKENKKVEKGTEEKEASYFAAALLMPRASFSLNYKKCKQSGLFGNALLFRLSAIYKAPLEIVAFRIEAIEEMEKDNV